MEVYATEEQQWEAIKNWLKKYWERLSWLIIIVLGILVAGTYWRHHVEVERESAGNAYLAFLETARDQDLDVTLQKGNDFIADHARSPYSALIALGLAKELVHNDMADKANAFLEYVMKDGPSKPLRGLARVRLMRLLWSQGALDEALGLYDEKKAFGFITEMAEIKGDVLLKQNDTAGAINAYKTAFLAGAQSGMIGPLLKVKMENLGIDIEALQRQAATQ